MKLFLDTNRSRNTNCSCRTCAVPVIFLWSRLIGGKSIPDINHVLHPLYYRSFKIGRIIILGTIRQIKKRRTKCLQELFLPNILKLFHVNFCISHFFSLEFSHAADWLTYLAPNCNVCHCVCRESIHPSKARIGENKQIRIFATTHGVNLLRRLVFIFKAFALHTFLRNRSAYFAYWQNNIANILS